MMLVLNKSLYKSFLCSTGHVRRTQSDQACKKGLHRIIALGFVDNTGDVQLSNMSQ